MIRPLLASVQFLTVVPIRTAFSLEDIGRSAAYFPVVGLLIGGFVAALTHFVFGAYLPAPVAAVLSVITLAGASGGLHLDGLADTADGFLSSRPKERILEIMRDSRIGTMGTLALIGALGLKVAALVSMTDGTQWRALLLAPVAGRCVLVTAMARAPYARPDGLATVFLGARKMWHALLAVAILGGVAWDLMVWRGLVIAAGCVLGAAAFNMMSRRKIGGITGDTLGAVCELAETFVLVAAAGGAA